MRFVRRVQSRLGRYIVLFFTVLFFTYLLVTDGQTALNVGTINTPFLSDAISFGFSAFIALDFLAVGTLVWLFARDRRIAFLLFCVSLTSMMTFTLQTGTLKGNPILSVMSNIGAALSFALFAFLLLLFPRDYYTLLYRRHELQQKSSGTRWFSLYRLLQGYLLVVGALGIISSINITVFYLHQPKIHSWLFSISYIYYLLVLTGIIATIVASYRHVSQGRERQQLRLFSVGGIVAFAPLLILTVLPTLLSYVGLPTRYVVNSQISTAMVLLLPAAIGYSILRYQLLVFD